jgi:hypothetical protein
MSFLHPELEIRSFIVEVQALGLDKRFARVSVSKLFKKRNCFRELGKMLEEVSKTFGGFVAITIVPEIEEVRHGQGEQAASSASEPGVGGEELGQNLRDEAPAPDATMLPGITPDPNDPSVAAIPERTEEVKP